VFIRALSAYEDFRIDNGSPEVYYAICYIHFTNVTKVVISYGILYSFVHGIYI